MTRKTYAGSEARSSAQAPEPRLKRLIRARRHMGGNEKDNFPSIDKQEMSRTARRPTKLQPGFQTIQITRIICRHTIRFWKNIAA